MMNESENLGGDVEFVGVLEEDPISEASSSNGESSKSQFRKYYTLPAFRYRNFALFLLFVDFVTIVVLWLIAGNTDYMITNIKQFDLLYSVLDIVGVTALKVVLLWAFFTCLEDVSMYQITRPYESELSRKKKIYHLLITFSLLLALGYGLIKGGLILNAMLHGDDSYKGMHIMYYAVCISTVAFTAVELLVSFYSFKAMKRLKVFRILHRYNDLDQEIDTEGKVIKSKADLRRVLKLARPEAGILSIGCLALLVGTASQTAAPLFFGLVVDAALQSMAKLNSTIMMLVLFYLVVSLAYFFRASSLHPAKLNHTIMMLVLFYLVGSVASFFRSWLFTLAGQRMVARLRKQLFSSIIKQEVAFFDVTRTGELTNRLSSDTTVIQNAITVNISMLARYILQIFGSLVVMFYLNPDLTLVLLSVVPIVSIVAVQYGTYLQNLTKDFQDRLADSATTAEENISSLRTVRSFYGEVKADVSYGQDIDKSYAVGKKLAFLQGMFGAVIGTLASGATCLVLWYGGKLLHDQKVTAGILTAFLLYTLQVALAFALLSSLYGDFMKAVGASIRIFDLMDRVPTVGYEDNLQQPQTFDNSVAFDSVRFSYPARPDTQVLKGVSFSVSPGEMVALVGPSGGGKSTIVNMIERFYDPDSGAIMLGGHNVRWLDQRYFRSRVALVSQEPTLFACSIKDNITYGKDASMDEVIAICKQANAHDFIMSFGEQYDTLVGEKGIRLSGGQKQRVAIARALIMDPAVLLLDEATSALDAESEHLVQQAVDNAMKNRTVIVIAHRLSTVRNAHKVIVIDQGKIAEQGTHEQLITLNGVYKKLVLRQLNASQQQEADAEQNADEDLIALNEEQNIN